MYSIDPTKAKLLVFHDVIGDLPNLSEKILVLKLLDLFPTATI